MRFDHTLLIALLGVISTIPDEILTRLLMFLEVGKYSVYQLASLIVTLNRPNFILGFILSSEVGGMIAVVFYYALRKISSNYLLIKGLLIRILGWTFLELLFTWLIEGRHLIQPRPVGDYYSEMFRVLFFGLTLGLLFKRYIKI